MPVSITLDKDISRYWKYIKNANNEIKLNLISLLSLSLTNNKDIEFNSPEENSDMTENFLKKYSGSWKGDESAEEIIKIIKSNRSSKEPPLFD